MVISGEPWWQSLIATLGHEGVTSTGAQIEEPPDITSGFGVEKLRKPTYTVWWNSWKKHIVSYNGLVFLVFYVQKKWDESQFDKHAFQMAIETTI